MPYTMMLWDIDDEEIPPEHGDLFVVTNVQPGVRDMHWGYGTHIELEPYAGHDADLADARRVARLWYRQAQEQPVEVEITGTEMVEALQAERQARQDAEQRAKCAEALVANTREAVEWLWGFYDGNTLVARPGYEDDIREAWGRLLTAATDAKATTDLLDRLEKAEALQAERQERVEAERCHRAALALAESRAERLEKLDAAEAALAGCGIAGIHDEFDGLPDAIEQMAAHIKELEGEPVVVEITGKEMVEALQNERQLRREAERRTRSAEHRLGVLHSTMTRMHETAKHAEALAQLVTPELATLLERLVDFIAYAHAGDGYDYEHWFEEPFKDDPNHARELAARIREALEANDD